MTVFNFICFFFWEADETMEENEIDSSTDDEMYDQTNFDTFTIDETVEQTYYYSSNDDDVSDGDQENLEEFSINGENNFGSTSTEEDRLKQKMVNRGSKENVQRQKTPSAKQSNKNRNPTPKPLKSGFKYIYILLTFFSYLLKITLRQTESFIFILQLI